MKPDLKPNQAPVSLWARLPLVARVRLMKLGILSPANDQAATITQSLGVTSPLV